MVFGTKENQGNSRNQKSSFLLMSYYKFKKIVSKWNIKTWIFGLQEHNMPQKGNDNHYLDLKWNWKFLNAKRLKKKLFFKILFLKICFVCLFVCDRGGDTL